MKKFSNEFTGCNFRTLFVWFFMRQFFLPVKKQKCHFRKTLKAAVTCC